MVSSLSLDLLCDSWIYDYEFISESIRKRVFLDSSYWSSLFQYEEALRLVHSQYVDRNKSGITRLSSFAVNGMLSGLDRHSRFFDPEEYKVFNDDTHREYVGIGVMIRKSSNGALITRVFPLILVN